jgi:hypothetical protein
VYEVKKIHRCFYKKRYKKINKKFSCNLMSKSARSTFTLPGKIRVKDIASTVYLLLC